MRGTPVLLACVLLLTACDDRINGLTGNVRRPPITAPTGTFGLVEVDDEALPHPATHSGTVYSMISGTFNLNADSTWFFSKLEVVSGTNGVFVGNSTGNYDGTWRVQDSTIVLSPSRGSIRVKGDTLFWRGGPRHSWEDTLTFTLVRK